MFGDVHTPGAASLVKVSAKVVMKDQSGNILQRRLGLETLLATLPMFDVTVPSDAIYSIIDLAHDTYDANAIPVDYGLEPEDFWPTLVADRDPGGNDPFRRYGNACKYAFARARRDIDVSELFKISNSSNARQFLRRVQATVWNRIFFTVRDSKNTVSFGLGPANTTSGDYVAAIFGCSVPVVLQEQDGLKEPSFKLVGECFVYGFMDREAVRTLEGNASMTLRIV
jgi:hypothetical protein